MDSGKKKLLSRLIASGEVVVERMDVKGSRRESLLLKGGKNSHFGLASRCCNGVSSPGVIFRKMYRKLLY